jgi:transcriptional regulator with XRE-family HTH domain
MSEPEPNPSSEPGGEDEQAPRAEPAGLADERFATNIREERGRQKLSQGELARRMAERGFPYYQQTIRRIEEGRRKVSVGEAKALADILETTMERLTWPGRAASAAAFLDMTIARGLNGWEAIAEGTGELLWVQYQLEVSIAEVEQAGYHGSDKIRAITEEARSVMRLTPEDAVAQGRKHHEELRETGAQAMAEAAGETGRQDHANLRVQDAKEAEDLMPLPPPEESAG